MRFTGKEFLGRIRQTEPLDDFTLITATQLHSWTGIPIAKIRALYKAAKQMICEFHAEMEEDIEDIHYFRQITRIGLPQSE
jgi:hypothetical protein